MNTKRFGTSDATSFESQRADAADHKLTDEIKTIIDDMPTYGHCLVHVTCAAEPAGKTVHSQMPNASTR